MVTEETERDVDDLRVREASFKALLLMGLKEVFICDKLRSFRQLQDSYMRLEE